MQCKMIWALSFISFAALAACGGSGSKPAASAHGADGDGASAKGSGSSGSGSSAKTLESGVKVCVDTSLGNRRLVEDALSEGGFEVIDSCMVADAMVREGGEPGAYELKYQRVGDEDWATCTSTLEEEMAFLEQCVVEMGGAAPVATVE